MKNVELKNCPNCKERIGQHDIECPYCKYIDDPKYKKHNKNLNKKKKKDKKKIYKILFLIPIIFYLIYLLFNIELKTIVISLILLNIMCLLVKKKIILWVMATEIISIMYIFIKNVIDSKYDSILLNLIILVLCLFFCISPKILYIVKTKKKSKRKK